MVHDSRRRILKAALVAGAARLVGLAPAAWARPGDLDRRRLPAHHRRVRLRRRRPQRRAWATTSPGQREGLRRGQEAHYIYEDSGYETEKAVAIFKKIMATQPRRSCYGESTGWGRPSRPSCSSRYKVLYGSTSFSCELADPENSPVLFISGPTYSRHVRDPARVHRRNREGRGSRRWPSSTATPSSARTPSPRRRRAPRSWASTWSPEIVTKAGAVDVTTEVLPLKKAPSPTTSSSRATSSRPSPR